MGEYEKAATAKKLGSAIPLAVVTVLILLAIRTGLLSVGLNSRIFSTLTPSDIAAQCVADKGLTMTLFRMNITGE